MKKLLTSVFIVSALFAQPAAAQMDMSEEEVSAFARVAMPDALRSLQQKCAGILGSDAYIYSSGDALHRKMSATSESAWPDAIETIARMSSQNNPAMMEVLAGMPPEVLRPFVAEMIAGLVTTRVEARQCPQINRALELLDPLPAENLAGLIAFAYSQSQADNQAGGVGLASPLEEVSN